MLMWLGLVIFVMVLWVIKIKADRTLVELFGQEFGVDACTCDCDECRQMYEADEHATHLGVGQ